MIKTNVTMIFFIVTMIFFIVTMEIFNVTMINFPLHFVTGDHNSSNTKGFLTMIKPDLTHDEVKCALTYDPDSGIMRTNDGAILETRRDILGNEFFVFKKQICLAGDLIWFLMTGVWPEKFIEHIDGNKANHAWSNLRGYVRKARKSATGAKGVYSYGDKYRAVISLSEDGVTVAKHLGVFDTIEKAQEAFEIAREERAESKRREKQYKHSRKNY